VIHTDFERGFIRAQTIAYDDFIAFKGEQGAKDAGKMRAEGKEYVVKDGDVMNFLFPATASARKSCPRACACWSRGAPRFGIALEFTIRLGQLRLLRSTAR
jgi:hypothetical protein